MLLKGNLKSTFEVRSGSTRREDLRFFPRFQNIKVKVSCKVKRSYRELQRVTENNRD